MLSRVFHRDHHDKRALSRYWDELVHQSAVTALPAERSELDPRMTVRAVHGMAEAEQVRAPFEEALLRKIQAKREEYRAMNTSASTLPSLPAERPLDRGNRSVTRLLPARTRHWWSGRPSLSLLQAATIIVIVAMLSVLIGRLSGDDRHNPAIFAPRTATPVASPAATPDAGLGIYRGNVARTGEMPGPGPAAQPSEIWKFAPIVSSSSPPIVVNGVAYIGLDNGSVRALNASTGEQIWKYNSDSVGRIVPTASATRVFATSYLGDLIALDAATGKELWRHPRARANTSPILVGNTVIADGVNGESFVLDQVTGQVLSEFTFPDWLDHSPAFVDGVAFGSGKGPLYAVNTATGNSQWEIDTGYANVSTPAVADGSVFVALWNGDNTGMMAAFDAATGEQRWTYSSPSGLSFSATSVANGIVVAGGMDGSIYGIHAADGTLVWSVDSGTKLPIISAPGIANGTAYVGTGSGPILALDVATGAVLWTIPFDSGIGFGPIVADGIIVVETNFGEIHAFGVGGPAQATPDAVASPAASPITGEPGTLAAVWSTGDVDFKLKDRLASGRSARPGRLARP